MDRVIVLNALETSVPSACMIGFDQSRRIRASQLGHAANSYAFGEIAEA
jgi:hypothetical protein